MEGQRLRENNTQIAWGHSGSSPPSQALYHHFLHCHLCTKDPQSNLPSGGRLPSLRLFPMQQPTKVRATRSRVSSVLSMTTSTSLSPVWLGNPSGEGATTAASIHPVPPHWCHHEHHPDKVNLIDGGSDGSRNMVKTQVYEEYSGRRWQVGWVLWVYGRVWHLLHHSSDWPVPPYHPLLSASHAATPRCVAPQSCQC